MDTSFLQGMMFVPAGGGGGGGISHVKTTTDRHDSGVTTASTTHNLDGSGSNRLILAFICGEEAAARSLVAATLGGNAASGILESDLGVDGGRAVSFAIAYWLDADHPGSGDKTLTSEFSLSTSHQLHTVMELLGVAQTSTFGARSTDTATQTTADALSLSVSNTGEQGEFGIVPLAVAREGQGPYYDSLAASNTENERNENAAGSGQRTSMVVWTDDTIVGDPVSYGITGVGTTTVDAWSAVAFAARAA